LDAEPKVKGTAFRSIDLSFLDLRGEAARKRALDLMHPEVAATYRNGLMLAASWYPISWYREVFRAFRAATGEGPELAHKIGARSVQIDMKSMYKMLFAKFVSPQTLLGLSQRLFSTYYDTGQFEVIESHRGHVKVRLSGCVGWDLNMWTEILGSCTALLEIAGAKEVRLRLVSGGKERDTAAELEAHWV
jgi:hypothetical protein